MASFSDYTHLVNIIGIHFQVRDDYMNLQSDTVSEMAAMAICTRLTCSYYSIQRTKDSAKT